MDSPLLENAAPTVIDVDLVEKARLAINEALQDAANVDLSWIHPAPSDEGWTLAPDALRFITSLVSKLEPRHVLELGSGLSTRVLARACASLSEGGAVSSVDHDPEFGGVAKQQYLARPELGCEVSMQVAPIVARKYCDKWLPVYLWRLERFASLELFDLVIVDGPPAALGGREGALYQVMDFAKIGTVVLLDDVIRAEEQTALDHWRDNYGDAIEIIQLPGFIRGLAAVIVLKPVPSSQLSEHRLHLTRREIQKLFRPEDVCIVVGDDWWREEIAGEYRSLPFLEHEGENWGSPPDDETAVSELERMRRAGVNFITFGRPFFWWLEHYRDLSSHLRSRFNCVLENDRLIVFDLHQGNHLGQ